MKDRIPTPLKANRKKITYDDGRIEYAKIEYADEPIEAGTPINKATLLSDTTAALYGLTGNDAVPDKALFLLPKAKYYGKYSQMSGASSLSASGLIPFSTEDCDDWGAINLTASYTKITIPQGVIKVRFYGYCSFGGVYGSGHTVSLYKNGTNLLGVMVSPRGYSSSSAVSFRGAFTSGVINVSAGDYFELHLTHDGTGSFGGGLFGMEVLG